MSNKIEQPKLNTKQQQFWEFFIKNGFSKTGYYPVFEKSDSIDPRISKFGGSIPHLPSETVSNCDECHDGPEEILLQLYVPQAPAEVQSLFPVDKQKGLLIIFYCTECMENGTLHFHFYEESQLDQLVFIEPRNNARIAPTIIKEWVPFISIDSTSNKYLEASNSSGFDDLELEQFPHDLKKSYHGTTFLLGMPFYEQGESVPGPEYTMLANFEQDDAFSMMWGDAGEAQIWMTTGKDFGKFEITWQCG